MFSSTESPYALAIAVGKLIVRQFLCRKYKYANRRGLGLGSIILLYVQEFALLFILLCCPVFVEMLIVCKSR